jgi:hypothetical protein
LGVHIRNECGYFAAAFKLHDGFAIHALLRLQNFTQEEKNCK